ncbi:MAG: M23 family metallopeptidase [Clostridiaceae bacterium]|nr:M23 family metallopeptidase [Clostridiaceae bacterium]
MKKSIFSKSNLKEKFIEFLNKKGFYIVLFMCVLIIGVTAMIVTRTSLYDLQVGKVDDGAAVDGIVGDDIVGDDIVGDDISQAQNEPVSVNDESAQQEEQGEKVAKEDNTQKNIKEETPKDESPVIVKQDVKKDVAATKKPQAVAQKAPLVIPPVDGEIIMDFSIDVPIYSKTMEDWRTHKGIDIRSERGTQVKAVADGIVEKVYNDDKMGITIVIDHGNGLKTVYSNLSSDKMVKEGQHIKQGEVISGVGDTAMIEIGDQPHLHFEMIKDGKNVDPKQYLANLR